MELALIRLTPSAQAPQQMLSPELIVDILWATATSAVRLEHIRARLGPAPGTVDLAVFRRAGTGIAAEQALNVCHRAIRGSPALAGWTATLLQPPDARTEIGNAARADQ